MGFFSSGVTAEHRPIAIDDLRRAEALGVDVGQDLAYRVRSSPDCP